MSDQIALRPGDLPWEPHDSRSIDVYHHYDVPLVGLLEQHACKYVFRALIPPALWVYASVSDAQAARLESAAADEVESVIESLFLDRELTAAMTDDDLRIVVVSPFEHSGATNELSTTAIAALERELKHRQETLHDLAS